MDLLGQIAEAAESNHVRQTAKRAADSLRRGVVAYSSVA
jgi:ATP-dependent RNA helicase HelY